ncbi:PREDICTED: solute carrier family 23 member 2-like [Priapulus caudatus]|uniref:Solute carrier family 23 member 2-like n=1 Tax=Priapulus caudatus TaxID=37621 RepID=A0ABM1EQU7_PRICU|nr:PREDICTED: solute carrier family 23 member 2-like [Priapulus caudatus]
MFAFPVVCLLARLPRLPIVQGASYGFLAPVFAILSLPKWQCPDAEALTLMTQDEKDSIWLSRMNEIQGCLIVASFFQVLIGISGLVGFILRFIGPLAIVPTISLIGLSLFRVSAGFASKEWWTAILTIVLITVFSQYLRYVDVPCIGYTRGVGFKRLTLPIFKLFPVILSITIVWLLCAILTASGALPDNPTAHGYWSRTDTKLEVLNTAPWFRFPYPFQWGLPTVSTAGVIGLLAGFMSSIVESVGDYYACARLAGAPPPPSHAINRGMFMEGLGCMIDGVWGSASGTTSYSENIGAIGITKVGSRRVIQVAAVVMMLFGTIGKFGALFVTIPEPIIGGMFCVVFGMVTAIGLSNLQFVDLNSTRNLFILGFSIIFGLVLPTWLGEHNDVIKTGNKALNQIITVLCSTSMFVGGVTGFVLDNTVPGTLAERGLLQWRKQLVVEGDTEDRTNGSTYDFPFGMNLVRKVSCFRYVPICPTFSGRLYSNLLPQILRKSNSQAGNARQQPTECSPPPAESSCENRESSHTG